jgi:hypothetical protein
MFFTTAMAELIRRAVDIFTASPDTGNIQDLRQLALAATGKFRSGKHDLSAFRNNLNTSFPIPHPTCD